jgi:hypothetical protein
MALGLDGAAVLSEPAVVPAVLGVEALVPPDEFDMLEPVAEFAASVVSLAADCSLEGEPPFIAVDAGSDEGDCADAPPELIPAGWLLSARQSLSALPCMPAHFAAVEPELEPDVSVALLVVWAPTTLAAASADITSNAFGLNILLSCFMNGLLAALRTKPSY